MPAVGASATRRLLLRTHLVFGANTDVGKTVATAGLLRARLLAGGGGAGAARYVKPLQCGGSDEASVRGWCRPAGDGGESPPLRLRTLFRWETAASPHLAARHERAPASDREVLEAIRGELASAEEEEERGSAAVFVETAGGGLSPSSASPENNAEGHARGGEGDGGGPPSWGWSTQADLYRNLSLPAVLVGDGRLGGISCTLAALEALGVRGYNVQGVVVVDDGGGYDNTGALREYAGRRGGRKRQAFERDPEASIVSLPPLPPEPEPLDGWFADVEVEEKLGAFERRLETIWEEKAVQLAG